MFQNQLTEKRKVLEWCGVVKRSHYFEIFLVIQFGEDGVAHLARFQRGPIEIGEFILRGNLLLDRHRTRWGIEHAWWRWCHAEDGWRLNERSSKYGFRSNSTYWTRRRWWRNEICVEESSNRRGVWIRIGFTWWWEGRSRWDVSVHVRSTGRCTGRSRWDWRCRAVRRTYKLVEDQYELNVLINSFQLISSRAIPS